MGSSPAKIPQSQHGYRCQHCPNGRSIAGGLQRWQRQLSAVWPISATEIDLTAVLPVRWTSAQWACLPDCIIQAADPSHVGLWSPKRSWDRAQRDESELQPLSAGACRDHTFNLICSVIVKASANIRSPSTAKVVQKNRTPGWSSPLLLTAPFETQIGVCRVAAVPGQ